MAKAKSFDPQKHGDDPKMIAQYLTVALATNDPAAIGHALAIVVRTQNVVALSKETGLGREGIYKKFRPSADPRLSVLQKLFPALGCQLIVRPIPFASINRRKAGRGRRPRPDIEG